MNKNYLKQRLAFVVAVAVVTVGLYCAVERISGGSARRNESVVAMGGTVSVEMTGAAVSDPLLVLVNESNPLPEDWQVTPRMVDDETVDIRMYNDLIAMFNAAAEDDVWFWVASGYRSVEQQEEILNRAIQQNIANGMDEDSAESEALRTIARPGYSEHHTGLAVDLNDVSDDFEETEAYRWLCENAAEYGFVQRYQKNKVEITGIDNESWHYRYVGKANAKAMKQLDMCLEEYVEYRKTAKIPSKR